MSLPEPQAWTAYGETLHSRLMIGTAGYPSPAVLRDAIAASGAGVVTVGLRRTLATGLQGSFDPAGITCPDGTPLLDAMRAGDTYVNVHTTQFPGGEIRGQIAAHGPHA